MSKNILTRVQMEDLTTDRLLRYYKSFRSGTFGGDVCDWDRHKVACGCNICTWEREVDAQMELIKSVLATREHVERK